MSGPVSRTQKSSKTFPIVISLAAIAMVAVIVLTITSEKEKDAANSKIEVSETVNVSSASINGKVGEASLPAFDEAAQAGPDPAVGMIVPQFSGQNFQAKDVKVQPEGKPYAIVFLAHWCPHCQKEVPKLVMMHADGQLPEDVDFIAVATGTNNDAVNYPPSKWLNNEGWPWSIVADSQGAEIANAFGLTGYPYVVYVNADGTVHKRTSGEVEDSQIIANANAIAASAK